MSYEAVGIEVGDLNLPQAGDEPSHADHPQLQQLTGQYYLPVGDEGRDRLDVPFRVTPNPKQITGLARFTAVLVEEGGSPTGVRTTVSVGKAGKTDFKASLKKLRQAGLTDGWHYVRVTGVDADGMPLPDARDGAGGSGTDNEVSRPYESARFFVVTDVADEDPPTQRQRRDVGLTHAARHAEFAAIAEGRDHQRVGCRSVRWKAPPARSGSVRHMLHAQFSSSGPVEIPLSPHLADLERRILAEPDELGGWRIVAELGGQPELVREPTACSHGLHEHAWHAFLEARRSVFGRLAGDGDNDDMVVEGRDLADLADAVTEYAAAYSELLAARQARIEAAEDDRRHLEVRELARLLRIDTVGVELTDHRGRRQDAVLVSPTHPLRLLWLTAWAALGRDWVTRAGGSGKSRILATRDTLHHALTGLGFPIAVPRDDGRLLVAADNLTPYWTVALPSGAADPQGLMSLLGNVLQLPERGSTEDALSGPALADRLERYVRLHPYVRTLVLNAVNVGRGEPLAAALLDLQQRGGCGAIDYDVRLFMPDPEAPGAGAAVAGLLRPEEAANGDYAAHPGAELLRSKLVVSLHATEELKSVSAPYTIMSRCFSTPSVGSGSTRPASTATRVPLPCTGWSRT